jgi:hypothetical protein
MDGSRQQKFPPVVYVPTVTPADSDAARLEMCRTADGRLALFVYSAIDRLEEMYGPDSPWVLLTVEQLQAAYDEAPFDLLLLDRRSHAVPGASGQLPGPRPRY